MKKLFSKLKTEVNFARAGEGHRLSEDTRSTSSNSGDSSQAVPPTRRGPTPTSQINAGQAAASRFSESQAKQKRVITGKVIRKTEHQSDLEPSAGVGAPGSAGNEDFVRFISPFESGTVVRPSEFIEHIEKYLLELEGIENSCLMIQSLTTDQQQINMACNILYKYINNIISNPEEDKYRKIRCSNKTFSEKVLAVKGTKQFVKAIDFEEVEIENEDGTELYFVMNNVDVNKLETAMKTLQETKPMERLLHRDRKVMMPGSVSQSSTTSENDGFFKVSAPELKRQQMRRTRDIEESQQLRTRAMREASAKPAFKSKYAVIRVKFPDSKILQGTFRSKETVADLKRFVYENINCEAAVFKLISTLGKSFDNDEATLHDAELAPCALLNLKWDENVQAQIRKEMGIKLGLK